MKIMLVGKNGQVGWELMRTLAPLGQVIPFDQEDMDLSEPDAIRKKVREVAPNLIVNAAAYTAVDKAESDPDLAMKVNGIAPGVLAEEAKKIDSPIVHYSTDYVFDGKKSGPYLEEDAANPQSVYGRTKLAGEEAVRNSGAEHLIFRTSWVYGIRGHNFLLTILRLAKERDELKVVDDQIGAPTWSRMIAEATSLSLAKCYGQRGSAFSSSFSGTYHLTSNGATSWHGFTEAILDKLEKRPKLIPIPTEDYPLPAVRPKNSILSNEKLASTFGIALPDWHICLDLCLADKGVSVR